MANNYAYYDKNFYNSNRQINRVFINPNFNRPENVVSSSSSMYFNPNFSHVTSNTYSQNMQKHKSQPSKTKIHVNPNFIRNTNMYNHIVKNIPESCITKPTISVPSLLKTDSTCKVLKQEINKVQTPMHVTKSRYCLVRQKDNTITNSLVSRPAVTTTVRVNKYKSVSLNVVKNILATQKPTKSTIVAPFSQNVKPGVVDINNTKFKFVKSYTALKQAEKKVTKYIAARRFSLLNKSLIKTASQKKNWKLKKNNIPCPLFKKYGNCLRRLRGDCEYLHDKKHVSICRKFLSGICHNVDCLLSHDLTDKKMPTCYFYLQGACIKESCPYLHVKLNEKTKICQDFLRGYCEKGDKCLFRHTNDDRCMDSNRFCPKKPLHSSPASKSNSKIRVKIRNKIIGQEHRYYARKNVGEPAQEHFTELKDKMSNEKCNVIKPNRIKLGTLPSFIQL